MPLFPDTPLKEHGRDGVLHVFLNRAIERPGPVNRIVSLFGQKGLCLFAHLQGDALFLEPVFKIFDLDIDYADDIVFLEPVENDLFINTV